jgi:transglutaminase-like putative cysteine protease
MAHVMARLHRWIIRILEPRVLFLLALLLVALGCVAHGLAGVVRELDAGLLLTVATLGALAGWMMAAIRLPGWLMGVLASLLGAEVVLVRVGRLGGKLATMVWALVSLIGEILRWLLRGWRLALSKAGGIEDGVWKLAGPLPDWRAIWLALAELWADISTLLDRGRGWVLGLIGGHPTFDPVATALVWSLAMWAVAVWAGWTVRRHRPLRGIAPAGALLMVTFFYTGAKPTVLPALLGTTLLLMAMIRHDVRERRWRAICIDFPSDLWKDLAVATAALSLALVVTAVLTPSISIRRIVEFAEQLTRRQEDETEWVAESFGLEAQPQPDRSGLSQVSITSMPYLHPIGSRPELSWQVVMVIYTDDLQPDLGQSQVAASDRNLLGLSGPQRHYYWRSTTYDRYDGHGWSTGGAVMLQYEAGEPVVSGGIPFHRVVRQEVQVVGGLDEMLYVAGILVTADRDFSVAWRSPSKDIFGTFISSTDPSAGGSTGSPRGSGQSSERRKATTYRADSLVPVVSEEQLRSAGSDYPEWVRERYLALPDRVPDRVLALARDLTATEPTPYDQARAIESYLRAFPYTLDVPSPPLDRDTADYFLFDLRGGHCDYYATAMVVLARAVALPARLVVGYASGTYDAAHARYIVTEADAHAWVEVYFPEYGWVEFEPTGSRPPIERLAEPCPIEWPEPEEPLEPVATERSRVAQFGWLGVSGALVVAMLVGIAWWAADAWWLRRLTPATAMATLYRRLQRHGQRLGMAMREGDTPYEFAASFAGHLADLARGRLGEMALASAVQEAQRLVSLYVQASYTPRPPDTNDQRQAIQIWRRLGRRLWVAWVLQRWRRSPPRRFFEALNCCGTGRGR